MLIFSQARWDESPRITPRGKISQHKPPERNWGGIPSGPVTASTPGEREVSLGTAICLSHISFPQWNQAPDRSSTHRRSMWTWHRKTPVTSRQSVFLGLFYNLPIIWFLKQSDISTWSNSQSCAHCGCPDKMRELWKGPWTHRQPLVAAKAILFL